MGGTNTDDPVAGIDAGIPFADLPHTWQCPVCESPKSEYTRENQQDPDLATSPPLTSPISHLYPNPSIV